MTKEIELSGEEKAILEDMGKSWSAICQKMRLNPTRETMRWLNLFGRIIMQAEVLALERKATEGPAQMGIEEWIALVDDEWREEST